MSLRYMYLCVMVRCNLFYRRFLRRRFTCIRHSFSYLFESVRKNKFGGLDWASSVPDNRIERIPLAHLIAGMSRRFQIETTSATKSLPSPRRLYCETPRSLGQPCLLPLQLPPILSIHPYSTITSLPFHPSQPPHNPLTSGKKSLPLPPVSRSPPRLSNPPPLSTTLPRS